jgi:Family of unknown function (DUF6459)
MGELECQWVGVQLVAMTALAPICVPVPQSSPPFDGEPGTGWAVPPVAAPFGTPAPAGCLASGGPGADQVELFARVLVEVIAGSRSARQLAPVTTERARLHLRRVGAVFAGSQPRLLRVLTTRPASDVMEATMIVTCGQRTRAIAIRLEQRDPARWLCTEMEAG